MCRLADGRVGFAHGALPGDHLHVEAAREHKSHVQAERFSLAVLSPERVSPPCPVAEACGGCDWMALPVAAQRRYKLELLAQALARTGGVRELPPLALEDAGSDGQYRSRLRFQIDVDGRLGFFARGSRRLIEIERCWVAEAELARAYARLRALAAKHRGALAEFESAELRVSESEPRWALWLEPRSEWAAASAAILLAALGAEFAVGVNGQRALPEQRLAVTSEVELVVPVGAFSQVNWAVNRKLVAAVVEGARSRAARRFCDLYAGAGNFGLPLLAAGLEGLLVEGHRGAVEAARRAAREQCLGGEFRAQDVALAASELRRAGRSFELVVLDPPRAGAFDILDDLAAIAQRSIAYVACDPVTLARDLRWLSAHGFRLEQVTAYDMFPHTHHFETLAWLERS